MNLEFAIIYYCHLAKFGGHGGNPPKFFGKPNAL